MKFCVIGLGRFGYRVATTLAENGMEVLGIDSSESIVASIRDQITQAICMRVNDEAALRSVGIEEMDTVVVAMGENFAQSILVTAILKKRIDIKQVITRAVSEIHAEILKLIGADQVILPEQEVGIKLADNLSAAFHQLTRLTKEVGIGQLKAPKKFIGKKISDLKLFETYECRYIGIATEDSITLTDNTHIIKTGERMVIAGNPAKLALLNRL